MENIDEAFSSIDLVGQCLLDEPRTKIFKEVINNIIKPGLIVLDAGTGSGILALLSAKAGASKVYAVELDPYVASVARNNVKVNHLDNIIEVVEADMRSLEIPTDDHIDIVIMEMLTTGMIDEFQVPAANHLKRTKNVNSSTLFLPMKQRSFVSFGYSNFEIYDFKMPMVLHLWKIHTKLSEHFSFLSKKFLYDDYDFSKDSRLFVDKDIEIETNKNGTVNAILLESESVIEPDIFIGETPAINGKVMIPVPERIMVKGDIVKGNIRYIYGSSFESFSFNWLS